MNASINRRDVLANFRSSSCLNQLLRRLTVEAWQRLFLEPTSGTFN